MDNVTVQTYKPYNNLYLEMSLRSQTGENVTCADPEGGGGGGRGPYPLKNYKNIGFLCNTDPDPLKMTKLPSQHSMSS